MNYDYLDRQTNYDKKGNGVVVTTLDNLMKFPIFNLQQTNGEKMAKNVILTFEVGEIVAACAVPIKRITAAITCIVIT